MKVFRWCPLLAGVAALLFGFPAIASAGKNTNKITIKGKTAIVSSHQAGVRKSGKVKVRVTLRVSPKAPKRLRKKPLKISLLGSGSVAWSPRSKRIFAGVTRVRPNRPKLIRLKLNGYGRKIVSDCGRPQIKLTVLYRHGRKEKTLRAKRRLARQKSLCATPAEVDLAEAGRCDFIAGPGNACLAPFPNNYFTKKDSSAETGVRLDLDPESTPKAKPSTVYPEGKRIDVTALNQSDGFSPGPLLSVRIPGMDNQPAFDRSGIVSITEMSRSFEPKQPVVLIDADSGERQLIWAELDSNAGADRDRNLIIRPGKNLQNGHRYIVAIRNLKDARGKTVAAPAGFRVYRDSDRTSNRLIENRRAHFESIFKTLKQAGVERKSLYLAWDFTVGSTENITGRMLSIRDRAFAELGDTDLTDGNGATDGTSPEFQVNVDGVVDYPAEAPGSGPGVENIRTVTGTFQVPCFLNQPGCGPGSTFDLDENQKPIRMPGNTMTARFTCNIPRSSVESGEVASKARPSLYGHGLFGTLNEVNTTNVRQLGHENGVMTCGTDWSGMSTLDVGTAAQALMDLSRFPALPDRLQQGFLNFLYLGRLMIHEDGFTSSPAFQFGGESVIDTSDLFYYGNSQGGIAGGALTAIATDFTRSVLYVPAMNYSTLLTRSIDFEVYAKILYPTYPDELERPLIFSLMQTMWDRGEPNGYANNMTDDPLPNTPPHKVMIQMAYGDHQVANVATEVEARTIGAPLRSPAIDDDRHPDGLIEPFPEHQPLGDLSGPAADGNAFFVWDIGPKRMQEDPPGSGNMRLFGTDPAPLTNTWPLTSNSDGDGSDGHGIDPHDTVIRNSPLIRKQIADFLTTNGKVTNPCGPDPCYAAQWNGMP